MEVTLYKKPNGNTQIINITKISDVSAKWFEDNNIPVSMEDCGAFFAVYADCGFRVDDDEDECPDEITCITSNGSCEDLMTELKETCQSQISSGRKRFN